MKKNKFFIVFLGLIFVLTSCQSLQEDMTSGGKRSKSGDEFLVHKKKPLVVPPDFETMPSPKTEKKETQLKESDLGIEELLNIKKEKDDNNLEKNNDNSLEQSILKKIKTN